ncbi:MAG: nitroreductase family protein, partial [Firmicutes bacterium]|nr:nitroreductase family protein [Bacillota bacterium]
MVPGEKVEIVARLHRGRLGVLDLHNDVPVVRQGDDEVDLLLGLGVPPIPEAGHRAVVEGEEVIPMSFLDLALRRRSTRSFTNDPVAREQIERCLEAARLAPSAGNGQPWRFVVVDDPELRAAVAAAAKSEILGINRFVPRAPVLVAVVMEPTRAYVRIGGALKGQDYRP